MPLQTNIIILIILIFLSGFFSGSEIALISLSKLKIAHLLRKKKPGIKIVQKLKDKPHDLLVTILIGNNLVNIFASAFAITVAQGLFQNNVLAVTTAIMTFLILTFGEIVPKNLALRYNVQFAVFAARPLYFLSIIFLPIIKFYDLFNIFFKKQRRPVVTEEEIKSFVSVGERIGQIKASEKELIHKIFRFDDVSVREIMTPKPDSIILDADDKLKDLINVFTKIPHSRVPVFKGSEDKIVGIVHLKDVFKAISHNGSNKRLKSLMHSPLFVPESKKIDQLLKLFQTKNQHMAIVVDEHGSVIGIVTLEDVLEEIVGEIQDESDIINPHIEKLGVRKWRVSGKAPVFEVNKKLRLRIKDSDDYDTFGGYLFSVTGKIPKFGEVVKTKKLRIKITRIAGQRILDTIVNKL